MILSIIIPTYNEEEYLPILLESIKKQNFKDYEIIIADANSTDKTREIAEEYGCIITEGGMPGVGRNNGAKIAKGKYLLFLDSDLELTDDYLRDSIYEFEMERLGIAITQMKPLSKKSEDQLTHYLANQFMIGIEKIKPHGAGCYGILVKKELHDECDGFNEELTFGEDSEYISRLGKVERFKVLRRPRIGVSTRRLEEEGFQTLIRQYGKSTFNDLMGKKTNAEDLNYGFEHGTDHMSKEKLDEFSIESERITKMFENYDKSVEKVNTAKSYFKRTKTIKNRAKKIVFYCVCGEGMGHAIRSGVIIDRIKEKYDVYIFSHDRAYKYLNEKFDHVYEIGGFNTVYINNKVNNTKTLINAIKRNPTNIKVGYQELYKKARKLSPNVIITDFEMYATIVSKLLQIPLITLDNIHMITQAQIDYPKNKHTEMLKAKGVIKGYVIRPKFHILTSFFFPKVRSGKNAVIYPQVIREEIYKLKPTTEDHIIVYQTSKESVKLVERLKNMDENFIVYGFNKDKVDENITYKRFNENEFYEDFANAKAVVCNGGFTFISEAITLKKPIYSVPASGNFEQTLNGFYVKKLGYGEYHENMSVKKLQLFLKRLNKYQNKLNKVKRYNNDAIIRELEYRIEKYSR